MVNTLLKYIGQTIKQSVKFIDRMDAPVKKLESSSKIYKGDGPEKEDVSISDNFGNACYIRQTQPEQSKDAKRKSSCGKQFQYTAKCRLIYYSFTQEAKEYSIDKNTQALKNILTNTKFSGIKNMAAEISISINMVSDNFEKLFREETGSDYSGDNWPRIIAIDFTLNYRTSTNSECQDLCSDDMFEVIESGPSTPPKTFCEWVADCQSIKDLQDKVIQLQEEIENLPPGFGCDDLDNCETIQTMQADIEEALQPSQPLGLIQIIDNDNFFFNDLITAQAYIRNFFQSGDYGLITDESYNNGVFYFTVPKGTTFNTAYCFMTDNFTDQYNNASFIDEFGLVAGFYSAQCFYKNRGNHKIGSAQFVGYDFWLFEGTVEFTGNIELFYPAWGFGESSTGKFTFKGDIGLTEINDLGPYFFLNSTSTIFAKASKYTSNAGGINGDLQTAITNGVNVFFDGIDKENVSNKVNDFSSPNATTYPTTQATKNLVDYYVQSNIKIIGDWDATSGSYPLSDESNTTPFIAQWGPSIKQGWAFRVGYGQAGTVHGFDYENGDVVYSLVDNPTDNPADWGDLDHNLQQANENVRGTSKVITDAIASDENTVDDERYVTGKKLWTKFWTRVLSLAWTWNLKQTFSTAIRLSSTTASQYLKTDASKDVVSVSAIPATDVTETTDRNFSTDDQILYNDFTSSGQTQMDSKLPIQVPQTSGVALTFVTDQVYGTIASPETGNITYSSTNAKLGVTNVIIHNHSVAPTFGTNMKKLSGSGLYTINVVNYIFVQYINSTEVIYSINQRT